MLSRVVFIAYLLQVLSKVIGLLRDILVARMLGASGIGDAYFIGTWLPTLLVNIGNLSLVPLVAAELARLDHESWGRRLRHWYWLLILLGGAPVIAMIAFAGSCVHAVAPALGADDYQQAVQVFALSAVNAEIWLLNGLLTAAFTSKQRLVLPTALGLNVPIGAFVGLLVGYPAAGIVGIAAVSLLFTAGAHVALLAALKRAGWAMRPELPTKEVSREVLSRAMPYITSTVLTNLALILFNRSLNKTGEGFLTVYMLTDRLWGTVGGLVSLASIYLIPKVAKGMKGAGLSEGQDSLHLITSSIVLYVLGTLFFLILGDEILPLLFAGSQTSPERLSALVHLAIQNGAVDFLVTNGYVLEHFLIARGLTTSVSIGGAAFLASMATLVWAIPIHSASQALGMYGLAASVRFLALLLMGRRSTFPFVRLQLLNLLRTSVAAILSVGIGIFWLHHAGSGDQTPLANIGVFLILAVLAGAPALLQWRSRHLSAPRTADVTLED